MQTDTQDDLTDTQDDLQCISRVCLVMLQVVEVSTGHASYKVVTNAMNAKKGMKIIFAVWQAPLCFTVSCVA